MVTAVRLAGPCQTARVTAMPRRHICRTARTAGHSHPFSVTPVGHLAWPLPSMMTVVPDGRVAWAGRTVGAMAAPTSAPLSTDDTFWADADRHLDPLRRRRRVHPRDHRPCRRELPVHRGRPPDPRLHLRPDERDPGPLAPGDRRHRHAAGGQARPPVQRHAQPPRRRPGPPSGRDTARTAGEGAAADHRRRVERSGHPDGQARHRQTRDRLVRPVLARHDTSSRGRHLQRGQKGLRPGRARQLRHPRTQPLPP